MKIGSIQRMLRRTQLIRGPERRLATFGETRIRYHLVSPVEDLEDRARLREGTVLSERPRILTSQSLRERFSGFDPEARDFGEWLLEAAGDRLRALEYRFRNLPSGARVLRARPAELARRIQDDLSQAPDAAVLVCPDAGWQVALLKLLLDESRRSFGGNVRELDSKGLFRTPDQVRRDGIEELFRRAAADRTQLDALGERLKALGLFEEYEDRFFALV